MWPRAWHTGVALLAVGIIPLCWSAPCSARVPLFPYSHVDPNSNEVQTLSCAPFEIPAGLQATPTTWCNSTTGTWQVYGDCKAVICSVCSCFGDDRVQCIGVYMPFTPQGLHASMNSFELLQLDVGTEFTLESLVEFSLIHQVSLLSISLRSGRFADGFQLPYATNELKLFKIPTPFILPDLCKHGSLRRLGLMQLPNANAINLTNIVSKCIGLEYLQLDGPLPSFIANEIGFIAPLRLLKTSKLDFKQYMQVLYAFPNTVVSTMQVPDCVDVLTAHFVFNSTSIQQGLFLGNFSYLALNTMPAIVASSEVEEVLRIESPAIACDMLRLNGILSSLSCICSDLGLRDASHCPFISPFSCPTNSRDIQLGQICDGFSDCHNGFDEESCSGSLNLHTDSTDAEYFPQAICLMPLAIQIKRGVVTCNSLHPNATAHQCGLCKGVQVSWYAVEIVLGYSTIRIIREASDRVIANLVRFKDGYNVYLTLNISNGNLFGLESSDRLDLKNYEVARIFDDTYSEVVPRLPDQYEQCTFNDSSFTSTTLSPVESSLVRTQISVVVVAIVVSSIAFVALYFVFLAASRRKRTMPQSATSSQAQLLAYNEFEQVYSRIIGDKTEFDLTFQLLTTSHECIQKNAMLHEGFFGPVFRGVLKTKGENKQVLIETLTDQAENAQKHFFFQCYLHHLLCRHPNILGLCGILVADTDTIRVMDIPFHATLQDHVKFFRPSLFEKVKVLEQVASGLAYLEAVSIVHRALCAENIYVGKSLEFVKIAGFVEARDVYLDQTYIASHKQTQTISDILVGSEGYIPLGAEFQTKFRYDAPEIIQYDVYSTKSDVFAFGVLMYETLTTKSCKLFSLSKQRVDLLHQHVPTNLISLFEACCNQEPKLRPSSTSMLESIGEWLTNPSIIEVRNCPIDLPGTFQWKTEGYLDCSNEFVDRRKTFCLLRACQIRSESYWWQWQRDCQIIPRLSHDHLVPVLDTFQLVDSEGSRYMAALTLPSISLVNFVATKVQDQPVLIEHAVIVDTVLALEYLAAQQLHPRIVEIEHCRIFEDCLKLQGLVFCDKNDVRTDHHLLTKYFEFLESCNEEFHELQSRNFHHTIQTLSQRILEARGCLAEQGQLLSIAAVHAQDTCNLGNARWNISWDDLCFVKPLGNGAFGEVVLMTLRSAFSSPNSRSGQSVRRMSSNFSTMRSQDHYVAVKTLLDKTARADFDNEMSLMRRLRHPNLISLLHVVDSPESPALVMEYLSGGSLDVWLVGAGKDICSESRLHLAYQVLCGLQELHRLQIVHRDLAARNILVSLDGNIAKVGIGFSA